MGGWEAALPGVRDCPGAQRGSAPMAFLLQDAVLGWDGAASGKKGMNDRVGVVMLQKVSVLFGGRQRHGRALFG